MSIFAQVIAGFAILQSAEALARKTNQTVYEETFDLASGGASLTRSQQEGLLFANPALLAFGGQFHRWFGLKTNALVGKDSVATATNSGSGKQSDSETSSTTDALFDAPLHVGNSTALAWVNRHFGVAAFYRVEPDLLAREVGEYGIPDIRFQNEAYGGAVASFAQRILPPLSVGVTAKYLYASETDVSISISDQERIKSLSSGTGAASGIQYGRGMGVDAGMLLFVKGNWLDFRLAAKADDVGNTKFSGTQVPFKQTVSGGVGITLHNSTDAFHFAADLRDVTAAYEESVYKRSYVGVKFVLREYLGLAAGLYQGYPSAGVVVDLIVFRVAATSYTREYGDHHSVGIEPRSIYVVSIASGYGG